MGSRAESAAGRPLYSPKAQPAHHARGCSSCRGAFGCERPHCRRPIWCKLEHGGCRSSKRHLSESDSGLCCSRYVTSPGMSFVGIFCPLEVIILLSTTSFAFAVVGSSGTLYLKAFGSFTYGQPAPFSGGNPAMELDTLFDIAR